MAMGLPSAIKASSRRPTLSLCRPTWLQTITPSPGNKTSACTDDKSSSFYENAFIDYENAF